MRVMGSLGSDVLVLNKTCVSAAALPPPSLNCFSPWVQWLETLMAALRGVRRSSFLLRLGSVEGLVGSEVDLLASGAQRSKVWFERNQGQDSARVVKSYTGARLSELEHQQIFALSLPDWRAL